MNTKQSRPPFSLLEALELLKHGNAFSSLTLTSVVGIISERKDITLMVLLKNGIE